MIFVPDNPMRAKQHQEPSFLEQRDQGRKAEAAMQEQKRSQSVDSGDQT
jgi:hypothetical protein